MLDLGRAQALWAGLIALAALAIQYGSRKRERGSGEGEGLGRGTMEDVVIGLMGPAPGLV